MPMTDWENPTIEMARTEIHDSYHIAKADGLLDMSWVERECDAALLALETTPPLEVLERFVNGYYSPVPHRYRYNDGTEIDTV
jgi:hypothetical protein